MLPRMAFAQDKKLKVAAIFATPIEEPWDHQIHVALQEAETELGIEYKWSEKVQTADFGRVMREYAQGGYELVLGDAFAAERELRRTAKEFPESRVPVRVRRRAGRAQFRRVRQLDPRAGLPVRPDRRQDVEVERRRRRRRDGHSRGQPAGQRLLLRRQAGQSRHQEEGHLHRLVLRSAQGQGGRDRADRRRRRRDLCRALRRHRGGGGKEDLRDLQHVRPVEPGARTR